ncbi:MAG TPA: hypothetical protein VF531_02135 [Bacillota bacterium]
MLYIAGILVLAVFAFVGYVMYCDISMRKAEKAKEEKQGKK